MSEDVQKHSVHTLVFRSLKRTHDMFLSDQANPPAKDEKAEKLKKLCKLRDQYGLVMDTVQAAKRQQSLANPSPLYDDNMWNPDKPDSEITGSEMMRGQNRGPDNMIVSLQERRQERSDPSKAVVTIGNQQMLVPKKAVTMPKPQWHSPWKLYRVISGHLGWVRCVACEPANEWFVTGAGDRIIKIWDLATGTLKLSLTGHISTVRGVAVSKRQPYLFSAGEDKQVKCWDLEYNKVIRHYHGHLSAVHSLDLHPNIDVLVSAGRDSTARVWDMRSKACIHTFAGHTNTVAEVRCQEADPQIITASHDCTIRLWDLAAGKSRATLTNHKKSVRSLAIHPTQFTFASGSADNIKQWKFPDGNFIQNFSGHTAIVNTLSLNSDGVLISGADNGTLHLWDWKTGYNFQRIQATAQPGSLDSESGIFASTFDQSGTRLITCEADKTIKIYKEDDTATEESHPINWRPNIAKKQRY